MTVEYKALLALVRGLSANGLDLNIKNHLETVISMGSVSDAEMIAYLGFQDKRVSEKEYIALMSAFEKCDDVI